MKPWVDTLITDQHAVTGYRLTWRFFEKLLLTKTIFDSSACALFSC